ncbi:hypothetical protein FRACYDRAFT_243779 [Fragilariopsis cylindrus CCMP1102]|uniref:Uncharacterized protein n=1 Tax=Fragilariopsis cylindrus CCMP1102 TaxID=635003 RepID=A0A1E7F311_9STRA|nr:hypothetical protein FRACYDRAFT_243779 [Fragilariopsis cylindrus CCMP1102]|eukprot:OEU12527.1 hypothetical protein FRACYDRAFT_243779 [Fragilariopsis cylindrus CCMP1102]
MMMTQLLRLKRLPRKRPLLNLLRSHEDADDDNLENLDRTLEDMFVRERTTYQNVWTSTTTNNKNGSNSNSVLSLLPLSYSDKRLDRQSRFLLQLLQTLYDVGLTNTSDRVTTERCNAIINRLASTVAVAVATTKTKTASSSSSSDDDDDSNANARSASAKEDNTKNNTIMDHWQRVERARSILECMEIYLPLSLSGQKFPMELPIPNHKTYFSILRMYSSGKQLSSYDANAIISLSEDTTTQTQIQTMNNAPLEAVQIVKRMEESNQLSLIPTSMHWNQVLSCYANSIRRPNRPLEAAKLLYELLSQKQNNTHISDNDNDRGSTRITSKSLVDGSSFSHTLRCCVNESALEEYERSSTSTSSGKNKLLLDQNTSMKEKEKYAKLALGVAQRVWSGLKQQQDESLNPNKTTIGLIVGDNIATDQINGDDSLSSLSSSSATTTAAAAAADNKTSIIGATATAATASTNTNVTVEMNSFHFVHMIRVARNFATLLLIAELEQKQKTNTVDTDIDTSTDIDNNIITEIRQRHEEWIQTKIQECIQKQKVNIYILQEIMYQGEIMNVNHHNKHRNENENDGTSNNNDDNDNDEDKSFEWIKRVMIMPSSSSSLGNSLSSNILHGMNMKWDKEILPALVIESNKKKKKKTKKNNTYATVIQQTRILFKYIPSQWISKAD